MSNVTFSFNLDPVVSAASQQAGTVSAESNAAIGAKFEAAQSASYPSHSGMGMASPACGGSSCFIVHGDGPGVTTLSVGEEDSAAGDFLTLPVVDGVQFLEPPVSSFSSAGEYDVTTLAIGEEDGGGLGPVAEIGGADTGISQGVVETGEIGQQFSFAPIETMPIPKPMAAPAIQPVETAFAQSNLPPIETTPIISSTSYIEPRPKPTSIASYSAPFPELKPSTVPASVYVETAPIASSPVAVASTPLPIASSAPAVTPALAPIAAAPAAATPVTAASTADGQNYVSVGDYDSYIASLGGGESGSIASTTVGGPLEASEPAQAAVIYAPPPAAPETPTRVTVTYQSPPPAPESVATVQSPTIDLAPDASAVSAEPVAEPVYVIQETATTGGATVEGAQPITGNAITSPQSIDTISPRIKPATFTSPGPAALPPIETVPIESSGIGAMPVQQGVPLGADTTFATIDGPVPSGKPESIAGDAPRLSADDLRITTLALGEEDAGGG